MLLGERACGKFGSFLSSRIAICLHLISGCLPVFDELCRRSMNFVRSCLSHDSRIIQFVANYAVMHARSQSFLGRNVLFCARRYKFPVSSTILDELVSFDTLINSFVHSSTDENMRCFANFLFELVMLRERRLYLSDNVFLTEDVNDIYLLYMYTYHIAIARCYIVSVCS